MMTAKGRDKAEEGGGLAHHQRIASFAFRHNKRTCVLQLMLSLWPRHYSRRQDLVREPASDLPCIESHGGEGGTVRRHGCRCNVHGSRVKVGERARVDSQIDHGRTCRERDGLWPTGVPDH